MFFVKNRKNMVKFATYYLLKTLIWMSASLKKPLYIVLSHILRVFAEDTPALLEQLRGVNKQTLQEYTIVVHGLKGSCLGIFAQNLGEQAAKLEDAARAGRYDFVQAHNAAFIHDMEMFVDGLRQHLGYTAGKEKREAPDQKLLADLLKASQHFDIDGVDKAMAELTSYTYETDGGLIQWLAETVKVLGFNEIAERLARVLE
jgi:HPt (histidine-containing phosphotransfer) domain-containing protein